MKLKLTVIGLVIFGYGNYLNLTLTGRWKLVGIALIAVGAVMIAARFSFEDE